jgi:hypothetical protein
LFLDCRRLLDTGFVETLYTRLARVRRGSGTAQHRPILNQEKHLSENTVAMSDVDKSVITQAENVSGKPRRRGCLGHCARFWWAYLLALIVVVVIVVPCV